MNAFPSCNDELAPRSTYKHLGDCEQKRLMVSVPHSRHKFGAGDVECVVSTNGDEITHVAFGPAWAVEMRELGYEPDDSWVVGWLEGLARNQFVRRSR